MRTNLLDELRRRLTSSDAIAYARKRIAEKKLGTFSRNGDREQREVRARLEKTERQIEKLVDFVAEGKGTKAVAERLEILEREAATERKALAKRDLALTKLPTPDERMKLVFDLERRLIADVTKGREELKRVFRNGKIVLPPEPRATTRRGPRSSRWSSSRLPPPRRTREGEGVRTKIRGISD